jgi:hypothetical protein
MIQVFHKSWEGKELHVQNNGRCLLYWRKPDDSEMTVELYLPTFTRPTAPDDKRWIHFTREGIVIRNAAGQVFRKSGAGPTVSRSEMDLMTNSDNLKELWAKETGYVQPAPSGTDDYGKKGAVLIRGGTAPATLAKYAQPPNRGDAVWLFKEFLNYQIPNGGTLVTGRPDLRPQNNIWILFRDYLSSNHRNHPYHEVWTAFAEKGPASGRDVAKNLAFCRDGVSKTKETINIRRGEGSGSSTFTVGPRRAGW